MSNGLIRMTGIVGVVLIIAITALTIFHPGDNTATITAMGSIAMGLLAFLSSRTNAAKIEVATAKTEANTDQLGVVADLVNDNTAVTEHAKREIGEVKQQAALTNNLVNGQAHDWRTAVEKIAGLEAQIAMLAGTAAGLETGRQRAIDAAKAPDDRAT